MSKAFTRESDDVSEAPLAGRLATVLPEGTPNYLTVDGAEALQKELDRLMTEDRPALHLSNLDDSGAQLRRIDQRIREISETMASAKILPPPPRPWSEVVFGAVVTARKPKGDEVTYRIVGVAEVDLDRGWISWLSPVARALMNARVGDRVPLQLPGGITELEILAVSYPEAA
jgi:transcription elongation factor GreB